MLLHQHQKAQIAAFFLSDEQCQNSIIEHTRNSSGLWTDVLDYYIQIQNNSDILDNLIPAQKILVAEFILMSITEKQSFIWHNKSKTNSIPVMYASFQLFYEMLEE